MTCKVKYLLRFYLVTVAVFVVAKVAFMLFCHEGHHFSLADIAQVIGHGLSLDLSTSLYFLILPSLITLVSLWWDERLLHTILRIYYGHIATMTGRVGVVHHIDHSLLHGHIDLRGDDVVEPDSLADLFDKGIQSWHFLHVVGQHDAFLHLHVTLLLDIL